MQLETGQSIYDPCFTCGHFRVSHFHPILGTPSNCRRCQLRADSMVEPADRDTRPGQQFEDRGIACHAFKEKPESQQ